MRSLVGHGVGRNMHEDPQVPNYGKPGKGPLLEEGMVLAVEPMMTAGRAGVRMAGDGWAIFSQDGSPAAHFEFTVAITGDGPRILTPWHLGAGGRGRAGPRRQRARVGHERRGTGDRATLKLLLSGVLLECEAFVRARASPRPGSGGRNGSQSRVAGTHAERDHEGKTVGQADVREVQDHPPPRAVLVICQNKRHKQRQG